MIANTEPTGATKTPTPASEAAKANAQAIHPAFPHGDAVAAVMAADDGYVPYLSTLLQSIADSASHETSSHGRCYDLVVLTTDITDEHQRILKEQVERENVSLRFYDVSAMAKGKMANLELRGHFQIETYYRLLMQDIFLDWGKMLYLDSDMVVLRDIAELYDVDVDGYLLAACRDADTAGLYNGYDPSRKAYTDKVLKLSDPYAYFQAGTILFNLDLFRKTFDVDDMIGLAAQGHWKLLDQDVLNVLAQGCVRHVPMKWNVMTDWRGLRIKRIIRRAPQELYDEYMDARSHPAIVHYAGPEKPWNDPESDLAPLFWEIASKTPFHDVLIDRLAKSGNKKLISNRTWDVLYPAYTRLFPDGSRRREALASLYRKLVAGKRG